MDQEDLDEDRMAEIVALLQSELDVRYAVKTPSGGLHVVIGIDKAAEKFVFKERLAFLDLPYISTGKVEVKTGQCLTHVPGINHFVKQIYP